MTREGALLLTLTAIFGVAACASDVRPRASDGVEAFAQAASDKEVSGCTKLSDAYAYAEPSRKNRSLALYWQAEADQRSLKVDASLADTMAGITGASDDHKREQTRIELAKSDLLAKCLNGVESKETGNG